MSQNVWATIMPLEPVTLIFYWPKKTFSGQPWADPHFRNWGGYLKKKILGRTQNGAFCCILDIKSV